MGNVASSNKKELKGRRQRLEVLRAQFGEVVDEALATQPAGCAADDLLDAFAAAWTEPRASPAAKPARFLPSGATASAAYAWRW